MKKKIVALALVFCLALAVGVGGTLAYLTATTGPVTNTFTVGKVSFDTLNGGLDEAKVNEYGKPVKNTGTAEAPRYTECSLAEADRVIGNKYKLVPGHTYVKDPTIHMSSTTEDAYLFVTVENGISDLEAADNTTIAAQMKAKGWVEVKDDNNKLVAYVYYGVTEDAETGKSTVNTTRAKVGADADVVVFDSFTLKNDANVSEEIEGANGAKVNKYADGQAKIVIKAYAIQAEGFDADTTDYALWQQASAKSAN